MPHSPACPPTWLCPATAPLADCCGPSSGPPPRPHDPLAGAARGRGVPWVGVPELWGGRSRDRRSLLTRPPAATRGPGKGSGTAQAQWLPCGRSGELELPPCARAGGGARGVLSGWVSGPGGPNSTGGVEPTRLLCCEPDRPQRRSRAPKGDRPPSLPMPLQAHRMHGRRVSPRLSRGCELGAASAA